MNLRSQLWDEISLLETFVRWFHGAVKKLGKELMRPCLEFSIVDDRLISRRGFRTFLREENDYEHIVRIDKRSLDAL